MPKRPARAADPAVTATATAVEAPRRRMAARRPAASATPAIPAGPLVDVEALAPPGSDDAAPGAPIDAPAPRGHDRWTEQACRLTQREYDSLTRLKRRSAALARPMKRGELLRVGLQVLSDLPDVELFALLDRVDLLRR